MSDVFKAIADPTRREILLMLAQRSENICMISKKFQMSRTAVSKHIKILVDNNLVTLQSGKEDGRERYCHARLEALAEVNDYIIRLEGFWNSKLDGLNDYLAKGEDH
ncbi:metalloregulator ArsR/SmtB family transcription factor [Flagellimonas olearia]|uniref:Metalloregulator ArsR/SmtB family transcription factor n=1 Tax=Flagellimonas olearia TaxID=552546 RepID=A0A6I1E0Z5_9FLAO|nr:metalloregulator ArsR/SmtB family transcription factor [Allomuricauda olearia]KAB7530272.1 metalloregulator ArsR/SmtB family transcription factor [Allomuricauda olearia]